MKTLHKFSSLLVAASVAVSSLGFTACKDDDDNLSGNRDGVVLSYFGTMPATRGQEIQIHGRNLNNVKSVIFPIKEEVFDFTLVNNENINVIVPEEALAGHLRLVTVSGDTITSKSLISYDEDITVTGVTPTSGLIPGDIITITGECVYNIAAITFSAGVEVPSTDFISASRRELKVRIPAEAQSGPISFTDGAENEPWEYTYPVDLEIIVPEAISLDKEEYEFNEQMVLTGRNLQLVEKLVFPTDVEVDNDEFTVSDDGTTMTLTVPDECGEGQFELVLPSGVSISSPAFKLPVIKVTDVLVNGVSVGRDGDGNLNTAEDLEVGFTLRIEGENLSRVKRLFLPNVTDTKYTDYQLEGDNAITLTVPEGMNDGAFTLYQNPSVSTTFNAAMLVELPFIWKGSVELVNWGGNLYPATWDPSLWKKFIEREGAMNTPGLLTIYFNHQDAEYDDNGDAVKHILKITYADWSTPWTNVGPIDAESGGVVIDPSVKNLKVEVTQADIDRFIQEGNFVFYGTGLTLTSMKFEPGKTLGGDDNPQPSLDPVEIWSGNVALSWGAGGRVCLAAEDFEGVAAGTVLRIKYNATADVWCQAQINDGNWCQGRSWHWVATNFPEDLFDGDGNPITSYEFDQTWVPSDMYGWNDFASFHEADFILSQDILNQIMEFRQDCDQENAVDVGIIIQGSDITITNVYLVPQK